MQFIDNAHGHQQNSAVHLGYREQRKHCLPFLYITTSTSKLTQHKMLTQYKLQLFSELPLGFVRQAEKCLNDALISVTSRSNYSDVICRHTWNHGKWKIALIIKYDRSHRNTARGCFKIINIIYMAQFYFNLTTFRIQITTF